MDRRNSSTRTGLLKRAGAFGAGAGIALAGGALASLIAVALRIAKEAHVPLAVVLAHIPQVISAVPKGITSGLRKRSGSRCMRIRCWRVSELPLLRCWGFEAGKVGQVVGDTDGFEPLDVWAGKAALASCRDH